MKFKALTQFLDEIPERYGVPGTDCIIYHHHKEVFRHQSGYSEVETNRPMDPKQLYNLYSASKLVTCVAGLQLFEQGAFLLTDPLYEYIPEYRTMYIKDRGLVREASKPILVRDLFTMCAGFNYDTRSKAILSVKKETEHRCPTMTVVKALAKESLDFEPGSRWQYSLCHDVLGGLIEAISGKTFGEFCRENIFMPLGMHDTTFLPDAEAEKRLAPMYMFNEETEQPERISAQNVFRFGSEYESGGAGVVSSVEDYIKFVDALCSGGVAQNGEKILNRRTINLMRTCHLQGQPLQDFFEYAQNHMPGYGYGLGVRTMMDPVKGGSSGPVGEFGWGGAAGAYALMDPENDLAVYYCQHMLTSREELIHRRLRNIIYSCID